jgi:osmotically-inducible protein OsmY
MTKTDDQLKRDIKAELSWDPKVNAAQIGVSLNEGAVSLLGTVDAVAWVRGSGDQKAAARVPAVEPRA